MEDMDRLTAAVFIFTLFLEAHSQVSLPCGGNGCSSQQCIKLKDCTELLEGYLPLEFPLSRRVISILKKAHCGFDKWQPKVCCPSKDSPTITKNKENNQSEFWQLGEDTSHFLVESNVKDNSFSQNLNESRFINIPVVKINQTSPWELLNKLPSSTQLGTVDQFTPPPNQQPPREKDIWDDPIAWGNPTDPTDSQGSTNNFGQLFQEVTTPIPSSRSSLMTIPSKAAAVDRLADVTSISNLPDVTRHKNYGLLPSDCGESKHKNGQTRIGVYKHSWMALLAHNIQGRIRYACVGTIINNLYILTAASCITQLGDGVSFAGLRVGEYDLSKDEDCDDNGQNCAPALQDFAFEDFKVHREFNKETLQNDIALIRLTRTIDFTRENAKPICLPTDAQQMNLELESMTMIVAGWPEEDGLKTQKLEEKTVALISNSRCKQLTAGKNIPISDKNACAEKTLPCSSNFGSPLMLSSTVSSKTSYIQHGIVSYNPENCTLANVVLFMRVSYYMDWILDNINSE